MTAHALTIDLEDWRQVMHRRMTGDIIPPSPTVIDETYRVLNLLDEAGVSATFFVVGSVAQAFPGLIREVDRRGHEIGSHSHQHDMPSRMDRDDFKRDIARSVVRLEDITGKAVKGFRAPEFSVGALDHWCFEVLCELGFEYDSSVFPHANLRYGIGEAPRTPFTIETPAGSIREFPLATWDMGKTRLPVAGGGYFRLLPRGIVQRALDALDRDGHTAVLYVHPYEFHKGLLTPDEALWRSHMRLAQLPFALSRILLHNFQNGATRRQLEGLFDRFEFSPLGEIHQAESKPEAQRTVRIRPTAPTPELDRDWAAAVAGE